MSARERIGVALEQEGKPVCDDCLVPLASLSRRQIAYNTCTELHRQGRIGRGKGQCGLCNRYKTINWLLDVVATPGADQPQDNSMLASPEIPDLSQRPWYWEGNVQSRLATCLATDGFTIRSVADTAARTAGKDIIAVDPSGRDLWVSVKGYPESSPNTQARHWFSGAVFDLILYRNESNAPNLALAFPDGFTTYRSLAARTAWLRTSMPFQIFWVAQSGSVRVE